MPVKSFITKGTMDLKPDPNEIFSALRKKIINLSLPPESVLNLSDLAKEFNVSRTPIKEVLICLQAEEWIMRHGSHFIVTPLSLERIREITEIRMVLEIQANIWAMERITPFELDKLNMLRQKISTFTEKSSNQSIVDFDFIIHQTIFKTAKNVQLAKLLERLLSHYLRFWLSIPRQIEHTVFFKEALELIEAINKKDGALIKKCTTSHIKNSVAQIMGTR
ncbi:MAG: GntR family transcriptional regulator [Deltaproteobacteria bacterium]|nr:GntR family transcriptional regulator [Deltaproteobacteria bacterium]